MSLSMQHSLTKQRSLNVDSLEHFQSTLESLENPWHRSFSAASDSLVIPQVILENDLKIHIFLEAVESTVVSAVAAAVASEMASEMASEVATRFKDPAQMYYAL